jgi:ABC-type polysaccharide/polyol phosphate transport system ATPase subunit
MNAPAVRFDHVWKKFRRGERHSSLRDLVPAMVKGLTRRRGVEETHADDFWALQDVSFTVAKGEALGIIGRNGAGKSTTLKLLTKLLRPNRGACSVTGRIGALIEVAAGFHGDLTGRENVFLQGAIMGMTRTEIARQMERIIDFAGVRDFIDTPVKRYSSGMNARLGFSIAAHLEPDVLIIDEILSVGDTAFQNRCVERMSEFKRSGVSIVFVSHNLQAVSSLCDRALLLQHEVKAYGPTDDVLRTYVSGATASADTNSVHSVTFQTATLTDAAGATVDEIPPGTALRLVARCRVDADISDLTFILIVHRATDGMRVYDGNVLDAEAGRVVFRQGDHFTVEFSFVAHLTRGQYFVACEVLHNPTHTCLTTLSPAGIFAIKESRTRTGVADVELRAAVHG